MYVRSSLSLNGKHTMKNSSKIIDWKNYKSGIAEETRTGHRVRWHYGAYEVFDVRSKVGRAKLSELWYGKPRYEIV